MTYIVATMDTVSIEYWLEATKLRVSRSSKEKPNKFADSSHPVRQRNNRIFRINSHNIICMNIAGASSRR
jgi:hypothetical protein